MLITPLGYACPWPARPLKYRKTSKVKKKGRKYTFSIYIRALHSKVVVIFRDHAVSSIAPEDRNDVKNKWKIRGYSRSLF